MTEVPQPPLKPIIGNLGALDPSAPVQSLVKLARTYGPFFRLKIMAREVYVASSQELVNELCDETRFEKRVHAPLQEIRAFAGDGLFTAYNDEPNWEKAHRLLMPAFGPVGIRQMGAQKNQQGQRQRGNQRRCLPKVANRQGVTLKPQGIEGQHG